MPDARSSRPIRAADWVSRQRRMLAVAVLSISVRLQVAAHGIVTVDEPTWMARSQAFFVSVTHGRLSGASVPIATPKTRPGVTTMWIGSVARFITLAAHKVGLTDSITTPFERSSFGMATAQVLTALVCTALIVLIAVLVGRLLGLRVGLIAGVLLAVEPFVVAHTVVLHTDGLLALTVTASGLALAVALRLGVDDDSNRSISWRWSAVAGGLAGLALLTKISALLYLPGLAIPVLAAPLRRKSEPAPDHASRSLTDQMEVSGGRRSGVLALVAFASALALTVFVVWPALWVDPVRQLKAVVESARLGEAGHPTFFRGETTDNPGPLYYLYVIALRSTPVLLIGGVLGLLTGLARRSTRVVIAVVATVPLPYLVAISLATKQFDRYSLPALITMAVLAAGAVDAALTWAAIRFPTPPRLAPALATGLALVLVLIPFARTRPYPLAYFNPLAGGSGRAQETILVGWGEGLDQIGRAITADRRGDCEGVVTAVPAIHNYVNFPCGVIVPLRARVYRNLSDVTYAVSYIADDQRGSRDTYFDLVRQQGTLIETVKIQGLDYARLWRIDHPPPGACADDRMAVPVAPRCG